MEAVAAASSSEEVVIVRSNVVSPAPSCCEADGDDYGIAPFELDPVSDEDESNSNVDVAAVLGEGWQRKAYKELHEKSEWRQRDIEELRSMVQSELRNKSRHYSIS